MSNFPRKPVQAGFTLLEIILVIFLMALILGLVSVYFSKSLASARFSSAARDLVANMRYAKNLAQTRGEAQTVTIDMQRRTYWIDAAKIHEIPRDINFKVIDPFVGEVTQGSYRFTFRPTGGVEGGSVVLWTERRKVTIQPDPVVGSVSIRE